VDPDALLLEMLTDARAVLALSGDQEALHQAQRVLSLHEWLSKGGFLPKAWDVPRTSYSQGTSGL
jgi:hypothetical protein